MLDLIRPMIEALRAAGRPRPIRVCDLGCGTGFVIRWLAARGDLGDDVELVGADYNAALIAEAARLASLEGLRCRFVVANAFSLAEPAAIVTSTGVLHHFRGDALIALMHAHESPSIQAFAHVDFQPGPFAVPGAWIFHLARMRERLSLHDGVLSAARAHSAGALVAAAKAGAPSFETGLYGRRFLGPIPRVFHSLVGVRPTLRDGWLAALGRRVRRLEGFPKSTPFALSERSESKGVRSSHTPFDSALRAALRVNG
jgi:SAM-dependent methyltransferase